MMNAATERFVKAIGYPLEEIERKDGPVSLLIDEMTITVEESRGSLILKYPLQRSEAVEAAKMVGYVAGRVLKEEAVVAYDPVKEEIFLWQKVGAKAGETELNRAFEAFMTSCEWWSVAAKPAEKRTREPVNNEFMRIVP